MTRPTSLNARIIERLYNEAIALADTLRQAFTLSDRLEHGADPANDARLAGSAEALRATTRMMHALAWLLNQRAYCNGELSEMQLRRYGKLADFPDGDPERLAMLDPEARDLIRATERFHARLKRIDGGLRASELDAPSTIAGLRKQMTGSARA